MPVYDPIVLHLIKLDLYNYKLVHDLEKPPKYDFNFRDDIFKLMGLENHEFINPIYANYLEMLKNVKSIDLSPVELYYSDLAQLAFEIWRYLDFAKRTYLDIDPAGNFIKQSIE